MLSGPSPSASAPKRSLAATEQLHLDLAELAALRNVRAENEALRAAARVLVDELGDAWWVRAGRAYDALEKIVGPTTEERDDAHD